MATAPSLASVLGLLTLFSGVAGFAVNAAGSGMRAGRAVDGGTPAGRTPAGSGSAGAAAAAADRMAQAHQHDTPAPTPAATTEPAQPVTGADAAYGTVGGQTLH
ncbi:MAG TPA: hypothetical protein VF213_15040, partial [Dongiaceae bacterium]